MRSSRTALIAMLLAVELVLVGLMFSTFRGWGASRAFASSGGFHSENLTAKEYAPVAAGLAPHVQIDDPDSGVYVSASDDGMVHVKDATTVHGFVWGNSKIADLHITRTLDGVRIERTSGVDNYTVFLGGDREHIDVAVPSGSHVDILRSSSAEVTGMQAAVDVKSQDGHIALSHIRGNVNAHSDDGHIEATDVSGGTLAMSTKDGSLQFHNITADSLVATTEDGRVEADGLTIGGSSPHATLHTDDGSVHISGQFPANGSYDFSTSDGRVEIATATGSDVTINASTDSGHIYVDGSSFGDGDSATHTVRLGSGSSTMRLASQDGSIHITTNGVF